MEIYNSSKKVKKILITISGIDGSGKSTIAKRLQNFFPNSQIIHIVNFRLINKISKNTKINSSKELVFNEDKKHFFLPLINLFFIIIDIIHFRFYLLNIYKIIICDRYFYDILVTHMERYDSNFMIEKILKMIPKPDMAFYLDVDHTEAQKRETGDFHSINKLKKLKNIFKNYKDDMNLKMIKNDSIDKSLNQIVRELKRMNY